MRNKSKEKTSVVKINPDLLDNIDNFINKEENKYRFVNKKQFVDMAVHEFLKKMGKEEAKND